MRYSRGYAGNSSILPVSRPPSQRRHFVGELRGYQRDGLAWLFFLQRFGFGGCLADDMGWRQNNQAKPSRW